MTETLVTTQWLSEHLKEVKVVDVSWYLPADQRNPRTEFEAGHIPGAVFYDLDALSEQATTLPHMLPSPEQFARDIGMLGVGDSDRVVVYDGAGLFSAARLWWMLRVMGHDRVAVLDGGLPKWKKETRALESGKAQPVATRFTPKPVGGQIENFASMRQALGHAQILDARSNSRFTGAEKEPRPGLQSGHMPGAVNMHYRSILNEDGTMKSDAELKRIFAEKGVDLRAPIITSCGSGVSAAILMLALARLGAAHATLYDASWAEWGGRPEAEIATG